MNRRATLPAARDTHVAVRPEPRVRGARSYREEYREPARDTGFIATANPPCGESLPQFLATYSGSVNSNPLQVVAAHSLNSALRANQITQRNKVLWVGALNPASWIQNV